MIWLTWRQFRASAALVLGTLAAAMLVLAVTGPQLADLLDTSGADFFDQLGLDGLKKAVFFAGTAIAYAVPAVVGVFWGAPMVARELEAGTHRLVWTQSVTRTRWLAVKLGLAAAGAALAGLAALALTWWSGPIDDAVSQSYTDSSLLSVPRLWPELFGSRGILPAALAVFALLVGVTAGLVVRRSVPAMAVTLVAVVATQVVLPVFGQPHLLPAVHRSVAISTDNLDGVTAGGPPGGPSGGPSPAFHELRVDLDVPGAWLLSQETVDASGQVVTDFPAWTGDCMRNGRDGLDNCLQRLTDEGYRQQLAYLPASRFWPLQLLESGILLVVAGALVGFCFWRIRRDF